MSPGPAVGIRETQGITVSLGNVVIALSSVCFTPVCFLSHSCCVPDSDQFCHYSLFGRAKLIFFAMHVMHKFINILLVMYTKENKQKLLLTVTTLMYNFTLLHKIFCVS